MALREKLEQIGNWLFRWRSYLPILLFSLLLVVLRHFHYPFHSRLLDRVWEIACLAISLCGLTLRAVTVGSAPKGTSGRNTHEQVADSLNTTGLYSVVRHPLYVGNFLIGLGVSLFPRRWWFGVIYVLAFWLYYQFIIFAEEEFLRKKFGDAYRTWASRTPAFLPRLGGWRRPSQPFSLTWMLRRENSSLFGIIATFAFLDALSESIMHGTLSFDPLWVTLFTISVVLYVIVRTLSKRTHLLDGPSQSR